MHNNENTTGALSHNFIVKDDKHGTIANNDSNTKDHQGITALIAIMAPTTEK